MDDRLPGLAKDSSKPDHTAHHDADIVSGDRNRRGTSDLSLDDLEAAQALEGLKNDCARLPKPPYNGYPPASKDSPNPSQKTDEAEPLLSLLTSHHPYISSAINGSLSAYTHSKSYSPRFRYGAELVERHIGSPVASTVGRASRITRVDDGVRWWLQRSDSAAPERGSTKRRKRDEHDVENGPQDTVPLWYSHRRSSSISTADTLPPYDEHRSPSYEQQDSTVQPRRNPQAAPNHPTWQSRLVMTTSGLGIAMSDESLRSLKYCLSWLRWANNHLNQMTVALQNAIRERQASQQETSDTEMADGESNNGEPSSNESKDSASISQRMQAIKQDILKTINSVVNIVSTYAGGALPGNARELVRKHLITLPHRFYLASGTNQKQTTTSPDDSEKGVHEREVSSAQRVVVLASEGLDMISQISGIVDGTIISAEEWCDRLGRKSQAPDESTRGKRPHQQMVSEKGQAEQPVDDGDESMPDLEKLKTEESESDKDMMDT
ncbi:MAG: hypothetical protein Q9222_003896 [Ikaeria aurantiellina]